MVKIRGILSVSMKGIAFVIPDDNSRDIHVKHNRLKNALNGDKVIVKIIKNETEGHAAEGEVTEIVERNTKQVTGVIETGKNIAVITPDDPRINHEIFVSTRYVLNAKTGDKVVAEIINYPTNETDVFKGKVVEVLGRFDAPGVDILSVMRRYDLYENFPENVEENLLEIKDFVSEEEIQKRRDLRELPIITIDGKDAKDLDDGVFARETGENIRLVVAIADVSHYVTEKSALDIEAYKRGTSVYLTDRVVPMLPKKLSNGICSLNANENRLAIAGDFLINGGGETIKSEFYPAVVNVKRRLTYSIANKILEEKNKAFTEDNEDIVKMLKTLQKLRNILLKKREKMGALEFHTTEIKINLNAEGKPIYVYKRKNGLAESIIEECMLVANEETAKLFVENNAPGIFRVHPQPKEDAIDNLNEKISVLGYFLRKRTGGKIFSKDAQEILKKAKGTPEENIINYMTLRSMEKAYYSEKNIGHFGLAKEFYTHFTSPIRRYPDLAAHRILKEILAENKPKNFEKRLETLHKISVQTSAKEKNAADAEREVRDLKAAEFMENFIGETFEGIITSVTNFGMFVEIEYGVEGLIHVSNMFRDVYVYDERKFSLIGKNTKEEFKLGDKITVTVFKTDIKERSIDFILPEDFDILTKKAEKKKRKKKTKKPAVFGKKSKKKAVKENTDFYKNSKRKKRKPRRSKKRR